MRLFLSLTIFITLSLLPARLFPQEIKKPAVSGTFYPSSKEELEKAVDKFIYGTDVKTEDKEIIGAISPHAGYIYSGAVAGYTYKAIKEKKVKLVILIGPSHFEFFDGISVYNIGSFQTPLGNVKIDTEFTNRLIQENPKITFYPRAFVREHSLEVQLPFLQRTLSDFKIVPVLIGNPSFENCKLLSDAIIKILDNRKDALIIASTDLSHYHTYEEALRRDNFTLSELSLLDTDRFFKDYTREDIELCGAGAVLTTIMVSNSLGASKFEILKYANSGDVTGDRYRVVGYASGIFTRTPESHASEGVDEWFSVRSSTTRNLEGKGAAGVNPRGSTAEPKKTEEVGMLNENQKNRLLFIARNSIEDYLKKGLKPQLLEADPVLTEKKGAFVTLTKHGELRGCIGSIYPTLSLYQTVSDMAIEAATGDPRFPQLSLDELKEIEIEISVLSPLEKIEDISKIKVGTHGLLIRKGFYSGLLLPQVATEYNWTKEEFLEHTCYKARLNKDAWKKGADIYIFSALVFGEEETKR